MYHFEIIVGERGKSAGAVVGHGNDDARDAHVAKGSDDGAEVRLRLLKAGRP